MCLSRGHGGISRAATRRLIAAAHGRASSKVSNDIGAIMPGRWQLWQCCRRIGATSFVKTGGGVCAAGPEAPWTIITTINAEIAEPAENTWYGLLCGFSGFRVVRRSTGACYLDFAGVSILETVIVSPFSSPVNFTLRPAFAFRSAKS